MFLNRELELNALEKRYKDKNAEFIVIYGRRRVGKSEIIKRFLKGKEGVLLLAREEAEKPQLRRFSETISGYLNDSFLAKNPFQDWDAFFTYLAKLGKRRFIIALDEFPYLIRENRTLPSLIQDHWDTKLNKTKLFFIVCGSSISMMEKKVLGHKSPLYGRRTGQFLIRPFNLKDVKRYLKKSMKTSIEIYSVFGGTPAYILAFDKRRSLFYNIENNLLRWDSFLYKDVEFLLREELSEPRYYFSILSAIGKGNTRPSHIINNTGLDKGVVGKYLSVLSDLQLVERKVPITENPLKSRKGLYFLKDNFFNFWFKYVYPYTEEIENNKQKRLVKEVIKPSFDQYVSLVFEDVCKEAVSTMDYTKVGKWWHKEDEIDIVALNERKNEILFGECKWKDNVDAKREITNLERKTERVDWKKKNRKERYTIFARSFKQKIYHKDVSLFDINYLEKILK